VSRGWHNESLRHSMAARGIESKALYPLNVNDIVEARKIAIVWLHDEGIDDDFLVKIRKFPKEQSRWIAKYRARSQFKYKPIFWINEDLLELMKEYGVDEERTSEIVIDNIIHEYAHVIGEWLSIRNKPSYQGLLDTFGSEEEFAEVFVAEMKDNMLSDDVIEVLENYKDSKWGDR
jgi:hypothetical protein